jgi:hypothetical protein
MTAHITTSFDIPGAHRVGFAGYKAKLCGSRERTLRYAGIFRVLILNYTYGGDTLHTIPRPRLSFHQD